MTQTRSNTKPIADGLPEFQLPMAEFDAMTVGTVVVLFPKTLCVERLDNRMQRRHLITTKTIPLADIAHVSIQGWEGTMACTLVIREHGFETHEIVMRRAEGERACRMISAAVSAVSAA